MSIRAVAIALAIIMAFVAGMVWQRQIAPPPAAEPGATAPDEGGSAPSESAPLVEAADPGLEWNVPSNWGTQPPRSMRVATYSVPAASGDSEGGECAVFHFGPGQGGGVEPNLQRWVDQFENAGTPKRSEAKIAGMPVHRVRVEGDYLAPAGPMMESQGVKKRYALLGAIIEGPNGGVFFKLTGPVKTLASAERDFDAMLASLHRP